MRTVLLGPQRFLTTAGTVARSVAPDGPVATVTAGWQDRESADDELDEVMGGRSRNLHLYGRLSDVITTDEHFAGAALALVAMILIFTTLARLLARRSQLR